MALRVELHNLLKEISENVYFQPPTNITMEFPCLVYKRNSEEVQYADNRRYANKLQYEVTIIDRNPDGLLWEPVANLPLCKFERHFTADGLNHDVFNLFF